MEQGVIFLKSQLVLHSLPQMHVLDMKSPSTNLASSILTKSELQKINVVVNLYNKKKIYYFRFQTVIVWKTAACVMLDHVRVPSSNSNKD